MMGKLLSGMALLGLLVGLGFATYRYSMLRARYARSISAAAAAGERLKQRDANPVLQGAIAQLVHPASYDASYFRIPYPNGDVPADKGACTDVVIRALRHAGYDLQELIHEDMAKNFNKYPRREAAPDSNIDHRRVPNLVHFVKSHGLELSTKTDGAARKDWKPGDIVCWKIPPNLDHTGIISDRTNADGLPLVIDNIGVVEEEDVLTAWPIVGHYRYPAKVKKTGELRGPRG